MARLLNFPLKSGSHINIPQEIGTKYFQFGIQLLNDETGEEIEAIVSKYQEDAQEINPLPPIAPVCAQELRAR